MALGSQYSAASGIRKPPFRRVACVMRASENHKRARVLAAPETVQPLPEAGDKSAIRRLLMPLAVYVFRQGRAQAAGSELHRLEARAG